MFGRGDWQFPILFEGMANCSDEEQPTTPSPHYDNDVNDDEWHPNSDAAAADEAQHEGEEPDAIPNPRVEREAFILCEGIFIHL